MQQSRLRNNSAFQLLIAGRTLSLVGASMVSLAGMMLAYDLTQDSGVAGSIMALNLVGMLLGTLPAGVVADRYNRKFIMVASTLAQACLLFSIPVAIWIDMFSLTHLGVAVFLVGFTSVFYVPSEQAALRQVVNGSDLPGALAANQTSSALSSIIGPPIAGALYGISRAIPFIGDALLNLIAAIITMLAKIPPRPAHSRYKASFKTEALEGVKYLVEQPALRALLIVLTLTTFGFWTIYIGVTLALQGSGESASTIGLLQTAFGVGSLCGAVLSSAMLKRIRIGTLGVLTLSMIFIICGAIVTVTSPLVLSILMGAIGVLLPTINIGLLTYAMKVTSDDLQGRVTSVLSMITLAMGPIASTLTGILLEHTNRATALLPGVLSLALAVGATLAFRQFRRIPRIADIGTTKKD